MMDTEDGASDASTVTVTDLQRVLQTRYNACSNIERAIARCLAQGQLFLVMDFETYGRGRMGRDYGSIGPGWPIQTSANLGSTTIPDQTASFCPVDILI